MNARILVTGGAGYIGSHTCKALARAGYVPIVLDDLSTGHRWAVKWGPLIESDIADRVQIARVIKQSEIKAVCILRLTPMSANRSSNLESISITMSSKRLRWLMRC
jgi:UDP-glucose 4-epimerase